VPILPERPLVPDCFGSEENHQRANHLDIGAMDARRAWAEIKLLESDLAARIFRGARERMHVVSVEMVGDQGRARHESVPVVDWIEERLRRLRAHLQTLRKGAGRRAAA
jgi:hypothetical protein